MTIKFGTSGWRAIISDEFTYRNVRIVTQAIADHLKDTSKVKSQNSTLKVIVGFDPRFLSPEFARTSAQVLAASGIKVLLCQRDVPTPTVAYEIMRQKLDGGINFTASHNPSEYNGLKFSSSWGGPALPATTSDIEKRCQALIRRYEPIGEISLDEGKKRGLIQEIDPRNSYIKRIKELVDLGAIKKARLKVVADVMYGTGRDYLDTILKEAGCKVKVLHNWRDVLFGGMSPEPALKNLKEMLGIMKAEKYNLGLGIDGDADRFGIVDSDGTFIPPNQVLALLADYLIISRGWGGVVARSVMTSSFVDAVANKYGVTVRETPVGFKYISGILVNEDMIIGGEESGGLTIKGHVPEKDGILACLLMAEMVAVRKKNIREILKDLYKEVGTFLSDRINLRVSAEKMEQLKTGLKNNPPAEIAGLKVKTLVTIDGFKFMLEDNSWVGIRLSGTEPVVRVYVDSNSPAKMAKLKKAAEKLVSGK
ncbi:MAG: phosphoglucomutase/phosphomannomutase family protein [bacterium]